MAFLALSLGGCDKGSVVEGVVVSKINDAPIAGANVSLVSGPCGGDGFDTVVSDEDGSFRIAALVGAGCSSCEDLDIHVCAQKAGYAPAEYAAKDCKASGLVLRLTPNQELHAPRLYLATARESSPAGGRDVLAEVIQREGATSRDGGVIAAGVLSAHKPLRCCRAPRAVYVAIRARIASPWTQRGQAYAHRSVSAARHRAFREARTTAVAGSCYTPGCRILAAVSCATAHLAGSACSSGPPAPPPEEAPRDAAVAPTPVAPEIAAVCARLRDCPGMDLPP
jgi:hypothetical protein